ELQPAHHEGQFIEPRVTEQSREALEPPVQRLLGVRERSGEFAQTKRRSLEQRGEQLGKAFVLGLPPGRREVLDVADQIGVCCGHRRLLSAEVGETLSVLRSRRFRQPHPPSQSGVPQAVHSIDNPLNLQYIEHPAAWVYWLGCCRLSGLDFGNVHQTK